MFPIYRDPGWIFPFTDNRSIPVFFLPGAPVGLVVRITCDGVELRTATTAEEGRVALEPPLLVRAGDVLHVLPVEA